MTTKPSSASTFVAWTWAIESLASFKQIDAPVLTDLVIRTPGGPDHLGRSAREMYSFRVLESLFIPETRIPKVSSAPDPKIGFDSSECCADVLERILLEMPESNLKDESKKLKLDVQPFIMHKRSCLPKCALEQLKDAILEGSHPRLASLKKWGGLVLENRSESGIHVVDGECNGFPNRIEGSGTDAQTVGTKGNSISVTPENADDLNEEKFQAINLVPSKRVRSSSDAEVLGETAYKDQVTVENGCDTHSNHAKKFKQDPMCVGKTLDQDLVSLHVSEQLIDTSVRREQHMGTKGCELSKEPQAVDGSRFTDDVHEEYTAAKMLEESCDVGGTIFNTQQVPCSDDEEPGATCKEGQSQSVCGDENKKESEGSYVVRTVNCESKDDMDPESASDNVGFLKEMADIATKKHALLSYKCMLREESFVETGWKDLNICMKCNKHGQLLICSSDACPLVIHESCLNSAATFDKKGNFYCYFCTYSHLVSRFQDAKKTLSLARDDFAAFIGLGMINGPTNFFKKPCVSEQTALKLDKRHESSYKRSYLPIKKRIDVNQVNGTQCRANTEQAEPSVLYPPASEHFEENGQAVTSEKESVLPEDKQVEKKIDYLHSSPRELEKQQITGQAVRKSPRFAGLQIRPEVSSSSISNLPCEPVFLESIGTMRNSGVANAKSITSNSNRFGKQELPYTCPNISQTRRITIPWTKIEEETLKEGVERLSSNQERGIPWRTILEFGHDVLKGRTTTDLKDKWRNMCKKSEKSK